MKSTLRPSSDDAPGAVALRQRKRRAAALRACVRAAAPGSPATTMSQSSTGRPSRWSRTAPPTIQPSSPTSARPRAASSSKLTPPPRGRRGRAGGAVRRRSRSRWCRPRGRAPRCGAPGPISVTSSPSLTRRSSGRITASWSIATAPTVHGRPPTTTCGRAGRRTREAVGVAHRHVGHPQRAFGPDRAVRSRSPRPAPARAPSAPRSSRSAPASRPSAAASSSRGEMPYSAIPQRAMSNRATAEVQGTAGVREVARARREPVGERAEPRDLLVGEGGVALLGGREVRAQPAQPVARDGGGRERLVRLQAPAAHARCRPSGGCARRARPTRRSTAPGVEQTTSRPAAAGSSPGASGDRTMIRASGSAARSDRASPSVADAESDRPASSAARPTSAAPCP